MDRQFQGLILKGIAALPQVVVIDGNPYLLVARVISGLQGTLNVEVGLAQIPEATQDMIGDLDALTAAANRFLIMAQEGSILQNLPEPDWSNLMPPVSE